jgi:hypothetical protein
VWHQSHLLLSCIWYKRNQIMLFFIQLQIKYNMKYLQCCLFRFGLNPEQVEGGDVLWRGLNTTAATTTPTPTPCYVRQAGDSEITWILFKISLKKRHSPHSFIYSCRSGISPPKHTILQPRVFLWRNAPERRSGSSFSEGRKQEPFFFLPSI